MMEFIVLTLSFTVAILMASLIAFVFVCNKWVLRWYMRRINKITMKIIEESLPQHED